MIILTPIWLRLEELETGPNNSTMILSFMKRKEPTPLGASKFVIYERFKNILPTLIFRQLFADDCPVRSLFVLGSQRLSSILREKATTPVDDRGLITV